MESNFSLLSGVSTVHHQHIYGKMRWAPTTEYFREKGEQGDPLMPLLFSLGQHRALTAIQDLLMEGERLFAFLDDICVICKPERVADVHNIWKGACSTMLASTSTMGKPKCGTGAEGELHAAAAKNDTKAAAACSSSKK